MHGYISNIEELTIANKNFRQVLYTAKNSQLVLMSLLPNEDIGEEIHDVDQFFRIEAGEGEAVINGAKTPISDGFAIIVPAGAKHNFINTSSTTSLKLYSLYCPPHHADKTTHLTKEAAIADDEHFDGTTTE